MRSKVLEWCGEIGPGRCFSGKRLIKTHFTFMFQSRCLVNWTRVTATWWLLHFCEPPSHEWLYIASSICEWLYIHTTLDEWLYIQRVSPYIWRPTIIYGRVPFKSGERATTCGERLPPLTSNLLIQLAYSVSWIISSPRVTVSYCEKSCTFLYNNLLFTIYVFSRGLTTTSLLSGLSLQINLNMSVKSQCSWAKNRRNNLFSVG